MTVAVQKPAPPTATRRLEAGDRLTRPEFEARYEAMPGLKKAELIEGIVYMPSPTKHTSHGEPHGKIATWLGNYAAFSPGVQLSDNATLRLDWDNEPQPDLLLRIPENAGGTSRVDEDGYLEGPPEFIVEVASSSASYDLHAKKEVYRRHGVGEYLVWATDDSQIYWWRLQAGQYVSLVPEEGILKSTIFPGLWLDMPALLEGNAAKLLETLQAGLSSDAHQQFSSQLQARLGQP